MKNFRQPGQVVTIEDIAAPLASGVAHKVGDLIGVVTGAISAEDIAKGEDCIELALGGVHAFNDLDGVAVTQGLKVDYDVANDKIVASGAGDFELGLVIKKTYSLKADILLNSRGEASGY